MTALGIKADVTGNTSVLIPVAGTSGSFHLSIEDDYGRTAHLTSSDFIITAGSAKPGDVDNNGTVDILDLVSIIDHIVSNTAPGSPENANANGSKDGIVDILDLVWIIDSIIGG